MSPSKILFKPWINNWSMKQTDERLVLNQSNQQRIRWKQNQATYNWLFIRRLCPSAVYWSLKLWSTFNSSRERTETIDVIFLSSEHQASWKKMFLEAKKALCKYLTSRNTDLIYASDHSTLDSSWDWNWTTQLKFSACSYATTQSTWQSSLLNTFMVDYFLLLLYSFHVEVQDHRWEICVYATAKARFVWSIYNRMFR